MTTCSRQRRVPTWRYRSHDRDHLAGLCPSIHKVRVLSQISIDQSVGSLTTFRVILRGGRYSVSYVTLWVLPKPSKEGTIARLSKFAAPVNERARRTFRLFMHAHSLRCTRM